jgi:Mg-chelatase subunit ChlD
VTAFTNVLTTRQLDAQVALTTFAEDYSFGTFTSDESSTDVPLTKTYSQITAKMTEWNTKVLVGDTNIEAGLAEGRSALTGTGTRVTAQRTIILLTDGVPTSGSTNLATIAANYRAEGIVTHVITFGGQAASGTNQTRMQNTAASGYGQYYHAPDSATLTSVFRQIAEGLPAVYVD